LQNALVDVTSALKSLEAPTEDEDLVKFMKEVVRRYPLSSTKESQSNQLGFFLSAENPDPHDLTIVRQSRPDPET